MGKRNSVRKGSAAEAVIEEKQERRKSAAPVSKPWPLEQEAFGKMLKVNDNAWTISNSHHPGGLGIFPEINNRCFLFRLKDTSNKNKEVLLAFGPCNPEAFGAIHELEKEIGLEVSIIVVQGGLHHIYLRDWMNEFGKAVCYVGPTRVPKTANGGKVCADFQDRIKWMDDHSFDMFKGQIHFEIIRGLGTHQDWKTKAEGGSTCGFMMAFMKESVDGGKKVDCSMLTEEVFCYVPSADIMILGENVAWYFDKVVPKQMAKMGMQPNHIGLNLGFCRPLDWRQVKDGWERIFSHPFKYSVGFHEAPGIYIKENAYDGLKKAVVEAGQLEGTGPAEEPIKGCACTVM